MLVLRRVFLGGGGGIFVTGNFPAGVRGHSKLNSLLGQGDSFIH